MNDDHDFEYLHFCPDAYYWLRSLRKQNPDSESEFKVTIYDPIKHWKWSEQQAQRALNILIRDGYIHVCHPGGSGPGDYKKYGWHKRSTQSVED